MNTKIVAIGSTRIDPFKGLKAIAQYAMRSQRTRFTIALDNVKSSKELGELLKKGYGVYDKEIFDFLIDNISSSLVAENVFTEAYVRITGEASYYDRIHDLFSYTDYKAISKDTYRTVFFERADRAYFQKIILNNIEPIHLTKENISHGKLVDILFERGVPALVTGLYENRNGVLLFKKLLKILDKKENGLTRLIIDTIDDKILWALVNNSLDNIGNNDYLKEYKRFQKTTFFAHRNAGDRTASQAADRFHACILKAIEKPLLVTYFVNNIHVALFIDALTGGSKEENELYEKNNCSSITRKLLNHLLHSPIVKGLIEDIVDYVFAPSDDKLKKIVRSNRDDEEFVLGILGAIFSEERPIPYRSIKDFILNNIEYGKYDDNTVNFLFNFNRDPNDLLGHIIRGTVNNYSSFQPSEHVIHQIMNYEAINVLSISAEEVISMIDLGSQYVPESEMIKKFSEIMPPATWASIIKKKRDDEAAREQARIASTEVSNQPWWGDGMSQREQEEYVRSWNDRNYF